MQLRNLAKRISIGNLPLRQKVLISFALSSVLPLLILVYLFLPSVSPELAQALKIRDFLNVNMVVVLVVAMSVLGLAINLSMAKSIKGLVEKTRSIYPQTEPDQDQELEEIDQLSRDVSSIVDDMQKRMLQLSQFEKDLTNVKSQLKVSKMELKKLAVKDELTELFNRRFFNNRLHEEVMRAKRYSLPLSLVLVDADDFKSVNDKFGHPVGDMVLKEVADLLKENSREADIVARYGGEEFAIILPETGSQAAMSVAERLRQIVEKHIFLKETDGMYLNMSVSMGLFSCKGVNEETMYDIVQKADKALYLAKKQGKNRVVEYSESIRHLALERHDEREGETQDFQHGA